MTPTDLELHRMLAGELPELITTWTSGVSFSDKDKTYFYWRDINPVTEITSREWLWITAECEKKLPRYILGSKYWTELQIIVDASAPSSKTPLDKHGEFIRATWQQRAIAYFKTTGKL